MTELKDKIEDKIDEVKDKVEKEVGEEVDIVKSEGFIAWFKEAKPILKFGFLATVLVVGVLVIAGVSYLVG